jgi:hypothetical protein
MIREHIGHIRGTVDDQSIPIRVAITVLALLSLPLFGTAARAVGSALNLGSLTVGLLAVAHVPVVVALVAIWSIGCEVCR